MAEKRTEDRMPPAINVSDQSAISMPIRNLISIVLAVGLGVWGYFGVIERLNKLETTEQLVKKDITTGLAELTKTIETLATGDVEKNNEFRIKWPRGELGQPPADGEQFMLIEHISGQIDKIHTRIEQMLSNGVNIKRLQEDVRALRIDVEKLKEQHRGFLNGGGHSIK